MLGAATAALHTLGHPPTIEARATDSTAPGADTNAGESTASGTDTNPPPTNAPPAPKQKPGPEATQEYRRFVKLAHPDLNPVAPGGEAARNNLLARANEAYLRNDPTALRAPDLGRLSLNPDLQRGRRAMPRWTVERARILTRR
jgi:hypothetical protein